MKKTALLVAAYLTIGQNQNLQLGPGTEERLDLEVPLAQGVSADPWGSHDINTGFHDRGGGLDLNWDAGPRLRLTIGYAYDKYELTGAPPTEDSNVHTSVRVKLF